MYFILLLYITGDGIGYPVEFNSMAKCEAAGTQIAEMIDGKPTDEGYNHDVFYTCVEK